MKKQSLKKYIYLSIAAAIITIFLKFIAFYLTDSIGFFSDALESFVNLFAAVIGLILLNLSQKPADKEHVYGHGKAEYFSSIIEGLLIIIAAFSIIYTAINRFINPRQIGNIDIGMLISLFATAINFVVARILIKQGKINNSIILEADGKHLMTDVLTSCGIIIAILLVKITGWIILDPIIAIMVAIHIIYIGYKLIIRSANGLMDKAISDEEMKYVITYLDSLKEDNIEYHSLMTRESGQRKFISFHILVPGKWTVQKGHDYADIIEQKIESMFKEPVNVTTHIEPIEDPASFDDIGLERTQAKL